MLLVVTPFVTSSDALVASGGEIRTLRVHELLPSIHFFCCFWVAAVGHRTTSHLQAFKTFHHFQSLHTGKSQLQGRKSGTSNRDRIPEPGPLVPVFSPFCTVQRPAYAQPVIALEAFSTPENSETSLSKETTIKVLPCETPSWAAVQRQAYHSYHTSHLASLQSNFKSRCSPAQNSFGANQGPHTQCPLQAYICCERREPAG